MAIIKLLSDFDGVWTDQESEADYVNKFIIRKISDLSKFNPAEVREILKECRKTIEKTPHNYGWHFENYFACYYGEDPFGDNNAIFDYINKSASKSSYSNYKQNLAIIKDSVLTKTGNKSLSDFSNECFVKSTGQFKQEGKLRPVPSAGDTIKKLNDNGIEIVIVSNSNTDKIEHLFFKAGHKATNEKSLKRGKLHAIGDARKYIIDPSFKEVPEKLTIKSNFNPYLRRRNYFKILLEEKPDYVLGDVFSLDLALPLYLRLKDPGFKNLKVIQKIQPHTPAWVKDYLKSKKLNGIAYTVKDVSELPEIIKKASK
jgi:FMN phosphatase YigB (HAD superfamily)